MDNHDAGPMFPGPLIQDIEMSAWSIHTPGDFLEGGNVHPSTPVQVQQKSLNFDDITRHFT